MSPLVSIALFTFFGILLVLSGLLAGMFVRPKLPNKEKLDVYECGEPTIGSSWVQFDLRFYIVGLVFLVFDVEVALFYPWAVVYGQAEAMVKELGISAYAIRSAALVDMLFFFGVLMVGFAYLWKFGYLDWVRSAATTSVGRTVDVSKKFRSADLSPAAVVVPAGQVAQVTLVSVGTGVR